MMHSIQLLAVFGVAKLNGKLKNLEKEHFRTAAFIIQI